MSAPLQMVMLAFDGNRFEGRILAELKRLREEGIVRLVGLLFVRKDADGSITSLQESDFEPPAALLIGSAMRDLIGARRFAAVQAARRRRVSSATRTPTSTGSLPKSRRTRPLRSRCSSTRGLCSSRRQSSMPAAFVAADGLVGPAALLALEQEFGRFDQLAEQPLN